MLEEQANVKIVFVRWETKDLILGSSDIEIYPYLKDIGISLSQNSQSLLKAYVEENPTYFLQPTAFFDMILETEKV